MCVLPRAKWYHYVSKHAGGLMSKSLIYPECLSYGLHALALD